jgi:hypothetical protein
VNERWGYVRRSGISALDSRLPLTLALGFLSPGPRRATLIEDGAGPRAMVERELTVSLDSPLVLELHLSGGSWPASGVDALERGAT